MDFLKGRLLRCESEVEIVHVGDSTTHPVTKRHQPGRGRASHFGPLLFA